MPDNQVDSQITSAQAMNNPGRRDFPTAAPAALVTAVLAATPAAGQDLSKAATAQNDKSVTAADPENTQTRDANPNTFLPPVTDHGEVQTFWSSFSAAHRRIQEEGWSRQLTVEDFHISKDIGGVNMRLTAGGIRESPIEDERRLAAGVKGPSPTGFALHGPTYKTVGGEVRVIDSRNFPASTAIAAAHVILKPGGLRELHWHQNADVAILCAVLTVFFNGGEARTADFHSGDVGYVPKTLGHYIDQYGRYGSDFPGNV
jgi:oxalate decarboxylase/phosphoglucose isomerase-like protein (cupin superfamily)